MRSESHSLDTSSSISRERPVWTFLVRTCANPESARNGHGCKSRRSSMREDAEPKSSSSKTATTCSEPNASAPGSTSSSTPSGDGATPLAQESSTHRLLARRTGGLELTWSHPGRGSCPSSRLFLDPSQARGWIARTIKKKKWIKLPTWACDSWMAARDRPLDPDACESGDPDSLPDGLGQRVHFWQADFGLDVYEGFCPTITRTGRDQLGVFDLLNGELRPRYLDPREVEMLLGVQEDWTLAPMLNAKGHPTGKWTSLDQRHELLGNGFSMFAINPLLERIQEVINETAGK